MDTNLLVLWVLIGINAIVSFKGFDDMGFFRKYEFHVGSIRAGEQFRMFTSAFLHADIAHLAFNMLTLYFFAPVLVYHLGAASFIMVYFVSLLSGSLLTLYFHKNDYSYRAIGASGAVVGVLFGAILLEPDMSVNFIPGYLFGILYLLFSIYGMKAKRDNIGHTAHFGGAIGGFGVVLLKEPYLIQQDPVTVGAVAIPIVIMLVMAKMGKL
jgi:membrane associated rhomboid family serine protease